MTEDATRTLFAENGFPATTLSAICTTTPYGEEN